MIALVGESGCGKSTITNLLLKQEKVDSGEITLNGIDLNYIPFEVLTKKVGFINHSAYIFNGTIEDNLRMGKFDANEREINEALKKLIYMILYKAYQKNYKQMLEKVDHYYQVVKSKD